MYGKWPFCLVTHMPVARSAGREQGLKNRSSQLRFCEVLLGVKILVLLQVLEFETCLTIICDGQYCKNVHRFVM